MLEAYEIGEASQWLGIVLSKSIGDRAKNLKMAPRGYPFVVDWNVPIKNGSCLMPVVNWPRFCVDHSVAHPPISTKQFYGLLESAFGPLESLPNASAIKYENTVKFLNEMLMP